MRERDYLRPALLITCIALVAGQVLSVSQLEMGSGTCPGAGDGRQLELITPEHHWIWLSCSKTTENQQPTGART